MVKRKTDDYSVKNVMSSGRKKGFICHTFHKKRLFREVKEGVFSKNRSFLCQHSEIRKPSSTQRDAINGYRSNH